MKTTKKATRVLSILLIIILFILSGCSHEKDNVSSNINNAIEESKNELEKNLNEETKIDFDEKSSLGESRENTEEKAKNIVDGNLEVHFIDVGQGDSILIKQGNHNMLIDAGDNEYGQVVVNYLKENGVTKLDYVIGTHPHSDHIGGLDDVIYAFDVNKVLLPNVTHTSKTFEDMLIAIQSKSLKISIPEVGETYNLGDANFSILAPNGQHYDNLNNYSIVTKLEYGNNSFLFTGDAENISENEILNNNQNLKADVLKVGHHGSNTSTISSFLNAVNPKYVIIQVGINNKYNHPNIETINKLEQNNIHIYRNDLDGIIIAKSDGENIEFNNKPSTIQAKPSTLPQNTKTKNVATENSGKYIGNKNSKIFHKSTCSSLPAEKNRVYFDSIEKAINAGYRPCKRCNP